MAKGGGNFTARLGDSMLAMYSAVVVLLVIGVTAEYPHLPSVSGTGTPSMMQSIIGGLLGGNAADPWGLESTITPVSFGAGAKQGDLRKFIHTVTSQPDLKQRWAAVPWMKEVGYMQPVSPNHWPLYELQPQRL